MSNIDNEDVDQLTADLRDDNFTSTVDTSTVYTQPPTNPFVKPKIINNPSVDLSPEQVIEMQNVIQQEVAKAVAAAKYDPNMSGQVIRKDQVPITDFSKLTMDDIYDLNVPIEAKAFMSADVLAIKLKDSNYEARWVNKNPQRLGDMIAKGFTYISSKDLVNNDAIQTSLDAQGHYCFNDVVAMKIDKATYYQALRHAHERAIATTDQSNARRKAIATANGYMQNSDVSNDFQQAARNKKMVFYDPDMTV